MGRPAVYCLPDGDVKHNAIKSLGGERSREQTGSLSFYFASACVMTNVGLNLFLVFIVSWFLHLGARVPILGMIRFDLILVILLTFLALTSKTRDSAPATTTDKLLRVLILYSLLTIPFVEWPGSVIRFGIPEFIKAVVFYYFTVAFVRTEGNLKKLIFVFLACQLFRVLEPLYLHITEGYWGDVASMANWELLNRLSGAPYDTVNSNGLAFIVCTILPFLYFLARLSWMNRLVFLCFTPACLYTLALTGSRTGFLALIMIFVVTLVKSKHRALLGLTGVLVIVIGVLSLSADMQDRYLSTFGAGSKNAATAEGRIAGIQTYFQVALRRPLFGHGLGTSREANANFGHRDQPAHNLYAEIAQELGFVGLVIFVIFLKSIFSGFSACKRGMVGMNVGKFLPEVVNANEVWLWMNLLFSFASYGLISYEWYLLGGLSVAMQRLALSSRRNEFTSPGFH